MRRGPAIFALLLLISASRAAAQPAAPADAPPRGVTWSAFVDTAYAFDLNEPPSRDRAYTTQPARHNEFQLNLAFVDARLERDRVRGRLALQTGTSVDANYAAEPEGVRVLQEAYAGYRLTPDTWIDAGIFFSHIGLESFVSRDNLTYTRSYVADYSPYYESGVRVSTRWNDRITTQLLVLNGWQNIRENNDSKSLGTQIRFSPGPSWTLIHNTYLGKEGGFRHFHNGILQYRPDGRWTFGLQADWGSETRPGPDPSWNGFTLIARRELSAAWGAAARVERYADPGRVLLLPSSGDAFQAWGASFGVDFSTEPGFTWRNEIRGSWASAPVFPSDGGSRRTNGVIVSSISAGF